MGIKTIVRDGVKVEPLKSDAKIWNNLSPDLRPESDTYPQGHGRREITARMD